MLLHDDSDDWDKQLTICRFFIGSNTVVHMCNSVTKKAGHRKPGHLPRTIDTDPHSEGVAATRCIDISPLEFVLTFIWADRLHSRDEADKNLSVMIPVPLQEDRTANGAT